ncbi:MAG TPA: class I SAM-dependent methyltransferase [Verrucomicrobiae bacterium]|jgi:ubiquinone/menaquinone biosynthesis C-methylase UbiE|nr:class I SAM-dependent methyltransferase [Verrucomicrobiae bacterium]
MSFNLLAPHYRWIEFVSAGDKLQQCRTALLGRVAKSKRILILGEGNGRFILECRRKLPTAKITCVDASARMLSLARRRLVGQGVSCEEINFICADALAWTPPEREFDLIVTHFFLDCFRREQVEALIAKLARAAAPGANWLLADFQVAPGGLSRHRSRVILWMLYRFFRITTQLPGAELIPPDDFLQRNGFELKKRQVYDWGLLHSDWWQLGESFLKQDCA